MTEEATDLWRVLKISEAAEVVGGGTPSTKDPENFGSDIPWITPKDLSGHASRFIGVGDRSLSHKGLASSSAKTLPAGTVLMSTRAPIGLTAIATQTVSTNQGCRSLIPKPGVVDSAFLYYLMSGSTEYLHQHANGTTFQEISGGVLKDLEFLFPPLDEQRRIALVLSTIDDKIESCWGLAKAIDELFHSVWLARFASAQDDAQESLREFCGAQYGVTVSGSPEPVGPRLLRVTDINKANWIDWRNVPYCSVSDSELKKYLLHPGDCVVARMADPGKSAMVEVPESAVFASYLIRIKPKAPTANHFLFGFLKSHYFTDYSEASSSGSVQQNINAQTILDAPCSLPDNEELGSFEAMAKDLRSPLVQAIVERNSLIDLRDFLLPRLLSGELRVAEVEEELEGAL